MAESGAQPITLEQAAEIIECDIVMTPEMAVTFLVGFHLAPGDSVDVMLPVRITGRVRG